MNLRASSPSASNGNGNGDEGDRESFEEREGSVAVEERPNVQKARRFKVIFHNDDYTTMEFVILVLMKFFHKNETEAAQVMLSVHHKGQGVAGFYPRDVAETKVSQVMGYAKESGMPLMVTAEPE